MLGTAIKGFIVRLPLCLGDGGRWISLVVDKRIFRKVGLGGGSATLYFLSRQSKVSIRPC